MSGNQSESQNRASYQSQIIHRVDNLFAINQVWISWIIQADWVWILSQKPKHNLWDLNPSLCLKLQTKLPHERPLFKIWLMTYAQTTRSVFI